MGSMRCSPPEAFPLQGSADRVPGKASGCCLARSFPSLLFPCPFRSLSLPFPFPSVLLPFTFPPSFLSFPLLLLPLFLFPFLFPLTFLIQFIYLLSFQFLELLHSGVPHILWNVEWVGAHGKYLNSDLDLYPD